MSKMVEPGKWYLVVDCAACGEPIPFAEVPSPEEKPDPLQYRTISGLACPQSGHVDTYGTGAHVKTNLVRSSERDRPYIQCDACLRVSSAADCSPIGPRLVLNPACRGRSSICRQGPGEIRSRRCPFDLASSTAKSSFATIMGWPCLI